MAYKTAILVLLVFALAVTGLSTATDGNEYYNDPDEMFVDPTNAPSPNPGDVWDPATGMWVTANPELDIETNGFTSFDFPYLFLGTRYLVLEINDIHTFNLGETTVTPGLIIVGGNGEVWWGNAEGVIANDDMMGGYHYAYTPPPGATGNEYIISFIAEYRNENGIVYKQEGKTLNNSSLVAEHPDSYDDEFAMP